MKTKNKLKKKIHTKGDVCVDDIKIGDIHYEFEYGSGIEVKVISEPVRDKEGYWTWKSVSTKNNVEIDYGVHEKYPHYGPNLYTYKAYNVKHWL